MGIASHVILNHHHKIETCFENNVMFASVSVCGAAAIFAYTQGYEQRTLVLYLVHIVLFRLADSLLFS